MADCLASILSSALFSISFLLAIGCGCTKALAEAFEGDNSSGNAAALMEVGILGGGKAGAGIGIGADFELMENLHASFMGNWAFWCDDRSGLTLETRISLGKRLRVMGATATDFLVKGGSSTGLEENRCITYGSTVSIGPMYSGNRWYFWLAASYSPRRLSMWNGPPPGSDDGYGPPLDQHIIAPHLLIGYRFPTSKSKGSDKSHREQF